MTVDAGDKPMVQVLGRTAVRSGGAGSTPVPVTGVKPRQILGILAVRLGQPIGKEELAERLWEGDPPRSYLATLESYVCVLRRQLGMPGGRKAVATASRGYLLDPDVVDVDQALVVSALEAAKRSRPGQLVAGTEQALAKVTGTLLASEPYLSWAEDERRAFDERLVTRCVGAAAAAQSLGEHARAEELAARAIDIDPLAEQAWVLRMRSLAATSRRLEALRTYTELRRLLQAELDIVPGPEAQELYLSLLGPEDDRRDADPTREVEALLGLLRRALEAVPGVRVPVEDRRLSAVAAQLVGAA
jgi:DNA-binding SARP family transcriptional activator